MFNRGSEWHKWDLHVHTPESGMNNQYTNWDNFIKSLFNKAIEKEIAVIGITDYFTIDGYKKIKEDYLNNDNKLKELFENDVMKIEKIKQIKLFPNIEFRLDKLVNNRRINYHVLFSDDVSVEDIEENFLQEIKFVYEAMPFEENNMRKLTKSNLEDLGEKLKKEEHSFTGSNFEVGCSTAVVNNEQIKKVLVSHKDIFDGKFLIAIPVDEDLSSINWRSQEHMIRKSLYQETNLFFSSNENTVSFGLGKKHSSINDFIDEFKTLKACIHGSDAHSEEKLFNPDYNRYCWIKSDTTFEGLKQIIYEPESRVKIQEKSPTFDFEKTPFTEIIFTERVNVFNEETDNVIFEKNNIPLNNGLVSIIGGRGTGKSILIDYISFGLGQNTKKTNYTKSDKVIIKRKASLRDEDSSFVISENPNIQFMYISQSEIKDIVTDSQRFTENIRRTLGVTNDYQISQSYKEKATKYINEYFDVIKIIEDGGTNSQQKKETIEKEIKKYEDFISNITSKENKTKLENYKTLLDEQNNKKDIYENLEKQRLSIEAFQSQTNENIQILNKNLSKYDVNLKITEIDMSTVTKNISEKILPKIKGLIEKDTKTILDTKQIFKGYSGDLTTLLNDVASYQQKVIDLKAEKKLLEENEVKFEKIKQKYFKELGKDICDSIKNYKNEIESRWEKFKMGNPDYSDDQKKLLLRILGKEDLDVKVDICFDKEKMYNLIMEKLDKRSWYTEKLDRVLEINCLEDYVKFVKEIEGKSIFHPEIVLIANKILDILFKRYTEFISHKIIISSKGINITKLSHGQQGTIFLRLKLAANLFSQTIIYDQPEDDLDNDFIMSDLVSIFREIKKYRQVIIVSHNSNLVVNADSEQVIVANNENGILNYIYGALENPLINEQVCKILEGGKEAFQKREQKYGLN